MDEENMIASSRMPSSNSISTRGMPKIAGRRILITGVNGFIGCHVAAIAGRLGAEIVGVDLVRTTARAERIRSSLGSEKLKIHEAQHLNMHELTNILVNFNADVIVHLAGTTNREYVPEAWAESTEGNALLTASVISAISEKPESSRPVLIMAGSQMEYGLAPMPWTEKQTAMPTNPYGAGKSAATELIRAATRSNVIRGCVVRFALVFGPGQLPTMIIPEVICKALKNIDVRLTEGRQQRRFLFVEDAAIFLLMVANLLSSGEDTPSLINAPACEPLSIVETARSVMTFLPNSVELRVGALANRPSELMRAWPDSSLADSMNLISLTPMGKGLALTVAWYMQNQWFVDSMSLRS